eukprot:gene14768-20818_t
MACDPGVAAESQTAYDVDEDETILLLNSGLNDIHDLREKCVVVPCMHVFCITCISTWLRLKRACPLCKGRIMSYMTNITSASVYHEVVVPASPEIPHEHHHARESRGEPIIPRWPRSEDTLHRNNHERRGLDGQVRSSGRRMGVGSSSSASAQAHIGRRVRLSRHGSTAGSLSSADLGAARSAAEPRPYFWRVQQRLTAGLLHSASVAQTASSSQSAGNTTLQWRRSLYSRDLWALPCGAAAESRTPSNGRTHLAPASADRLRRSVGGIPQLVYGGLRSGRDQVIESWIDRELRALLEVEDTTLVRSFVVALVRSAGLHPPNLAAQHHQLSSGRTSMTTSSARQATQPSSGHAVHMGSSVQPASGQASAAECPAASLARFLFEHAAHFWHELCSFGLSGLSLDAWDRDAAYLVKDELVRQLERGISGDAQAHGGAAAREASCQWHSPSAPSRAFQDIDTGSGAARYCQPGCERAPPHAVSQVGDIHALTAAASAAAAAISAMGRGSSGALCGLHDSDPIDRLRGVCEEEREMDEEESVRHPRLPVSHAISELQPMTAHLDPPREPQSQGQQQEQLTSHLSPAVPAHAPQPNNLRRRARWDVTPESLNSLHQPTSATAASSSYLASRQTSMHSPQVLGPPTSPRLSSPASPGAADGVVLQRNGALQSQHDAQAPEPYLNSSHDDSTKDRRRRHRERTGGGRRGGNGRTEECKSRERREEHVEKEIFEHAAYQVEARAGRKSRDLEETAQPRDSRRQHRDDGDRITDRCSRHSKKRACNGGIRHEEKHECGEHHHHPHQRKRERCRGSEGEHEGGCLLARRSGGGSSKKIRSSKLGESKGRSAPHGSPGSASEDLDGMGARYEEEGLGRFPLGGRSRLSRQRGERSLDHLAPCNRWDQSEGRRLLVQGLSLLRDGILGQDGRSGGSVVARGTNQHARPSSSLLEQRGRQGYEAVDENDRWQLSDPL